MRIAISGTYSTGKTTLSVALGFLTGIPVTRARTMREILPVTFPGCSLAQCNSIQLMALGMRRFVERVQAESKMNETFISDGCSIQEWLYGSTRMITGFNPAEKPENVKKWIENHPYEWRVFQQTIESFGKVVKYHAKNSYDVIIHLSVEFPMVWDGHRPASELFRAESDKLLNTTYRELGLSPVKVYGSMKNRLKSIVELLNLDTVMRVEDAIGLTNKQRESGKFNIAIEQGGEKQSFMFAV
jgi:nicotinamide riboside kinase